MSEIPQLSTRKVWNGIYKGVAYEINSFEIPGFPRMEETKISWTHYLWLNLELIPEKFRDEFWIPPKEDTGPPFYASGPFYDYFKGAPGKIEFHGGCTFYSKEHGLDGGRKIVKIGCDYQHLWDEGQTYDLSYVFSEVRTSIESFISIVGPLRLRDPYSGKYYDTEEELVAVKIARGKEAGF
jgi:hypothetical protein